VGYFLKKIFDKIELFFRILFYIFSYIAKIFIGITKGLYKLSSFLLLISYKIVKQITIFIYIITKITLKISSILIKVLSYIVYVFLFQTIKIVFFLMPYFIVRIIIDAIFIIFYSVKNLIAYLYLLPANNKNNNKTTKQKINVIYKINTKQKMNKIFSKIELEILHIKTVMQKNTYKIYKYLKYLQKNIVNALYILIMNLKIFIMFPFFMYQFIIKLNIFLYILLKIIYMKTRKLFLYKNWIIFFKFLINSFIFLCYYIITFIQSVVCNYLFNLGKYKTMFSLVKIFLVGIFVYLKYLIKFMQNNLVKSTISIFIIIFLSYFSLYLYFNKDFFNVKVNQLENSPNSMAFIKIYKYVFNLKSVFDPVNYYKSVFVIKEGDNLFHILLSQDVSLSDANEILEKISTIYNVNNIKSGIKLEVVFANSSEWQYQKIEKISLSVNNLYNIIVEHLDDKYLVYKEEKQFKKYIYKKQFYIKDSIYNSAVSVSLPKNILFDLAKVFSWDVDFQRDIQKNDYLEVLYSCNFDPYSQVEFCDNVLYASLKLKDRVVEFYKFADNYFTADAKVAQKTLIKTPVEGAFRLSSGFGLRKHPVLGYNALHKGIDFAAATGTPILAAGDGTIVMAGWFGSYGNYVKIKHNSSLETSYAHMNRIDSKIKIGKRVKQGTIIGYVGASGRVTGPHLHYEVLVNNKQINPINIKLPSVGVLKNNSLDEFKAYKEKIDLMMIRMPSVGKILLNEKFNDYELKEQLEIADLD
jgi:murein DD-endopeptidase MepM/ murein hydrolase activator NlpD